VTQIESIVAALAESFPGCRVNPFPAQSAFMYEPGNIEDLTRLEQVIDWMIETHKQESAPVTRRRCSPTSAAPTRTSTAPRPTTSRPSRACCTPPAPGGASAVLGKLVPFFQFGNLSMPLKVAALFAAVKFTDPLPFAITVPVNPAGVTLGVTTDPFVTPLTSLASPCNCSSTLGPCALLTTTDIGLAFEVFPAMSVTTAPNVCDPFTVLTVDQEKLYEGPAPDTGALVAEPPPLGVIGRLGSDIGRVEIPPARPGPPEVEAVATSPDGLLESMRPGAV